MWVTTKRLDQFSSFNLYWIQTNGFLRRYITFFYFWENFPVNLLTRPNKEIIPFKHSLFLFKICWQGMNLPPGKTRIIFKWTQIKFNFSIYWEKIFLYKKKIFSSNLAQELSLCHKLRFPIFETANVVDLCYFKLCMNSIKTHNLCLKYRRFRPSG